jgi:DNA mismatch repair protein MutL
MSHVAGPTRIRVLPPIVANQIAAGEVVERPASVVKELLENSLDARATTIEIDIEKGGVQRIRIRDDGHGIHHDDLSLALTPHATSKIATAADLDAVSSLGFRGEALASIASVSRLTLGSRLLGDEHGWQLGSELTGVRPVAMLTGTEIEMTDLFYNTPARRKFLRSERTEFTHLEEVVRRIALSRFDVTLRLAHNGKQVLRVKSVTSDSGRERRVTEVLGKPFLDNSRFVERSADGMRLWGWIGRPGYSRSHADNLYFYLNGRVIRDRLLAHAVRLAFAELIPEGRFPAYLLYLELDPQLVDVNVHPTKHEVRFRETRQVHDFIYWVVKGALNDSETATASTAGENSTSIVMSERTHAGAMQPGYKTPLRSAVAERAADYLAGTASAERRSEREAAEPLLGRALVQLRMDYLLAERRDTTVLVDLRAVLEELTLRRLQTSRAGELLVPQPLLIPHSCMLESGETAAWQEHGELLMPYGFEWGWLGENLLVLRQVPALLRSAVSNRLLATLTQWLIDQGAEQGLLKLLARHAHPDPLPAYGVAELNTLLREYEGTMPETVARRHWRYLSAADWHRLIESQQ